MHRTRLHKIYAKTDKEDEVIPEIPTSKHIRSPSLFCGTSGSSCLGCGRAMPDASGAGTGGVGGFLLWADLKPEHIAALDAVADEPATLALLSELLGADGMQDQLKKEVLLELHLNSLYFARKHGFSAEKTSTFFSIIKRNHEEMAEAFLPPQQSWEYFKVRTPGPTL